MFQKTTIITLLAFSAFFCSILAYPNPTFNKLEVDDLGGPNGSVDEEAKGWSAVGLTGTNKVTKCNGTSMLGGPGILRTNGYFEKNISSLPSHDYIYFRIRIFLIDNWQQSDTVILQFDGKNFSAGEIALSKPNFPRHFCGDSNFPDLDSFYMIGQLPHTQNNVTIRIISMVNRSSTIASFGVGRVNLVFGNSTTRGGSLPEMSCNKADVPILSNQCPCPSGTYQDPSDPVNCLPCDSDCIDCFGAGSTKCYTCSPGMSFVSTKCIRCHNTCSSCSGRSPSSCIRCPETSWYRWDGTCQTICKSPAFAQYTLGSLHICKEPCPTNQFYYWNASCGATCPSYFSSSTNIYGKFCNLQCSSSQYFYWNNSCIATCPSPLVSSLFQNVVNQCQKPCNNGEFYYPTGECLTTCDFPLITVIRNEVQECRSPCDPTSFYYDAFNSCLPTCDAPNYVESNAYFNRCIIATTRMSPEEIQQIETINQVSVAGFSIIAVSTSIGVIIGASNPATATLLGFVKMLPYIRYIKITYSPRLQYMLDNLNSTLVSFALGPTITQEQQDRFSKYPLPEIFDKYGFHSSFIVNYWQTLMSLIIIIGIIIVFSIIGKYTKNRIVLNNILKGLKIIVKWNFFLMIFCTNLDSIVLGTSLQLRTMYFDSFLSAFSILFCFVLNFFTFFILGLIYFIIRDIRRKKLVYPKETPEAYNPEERWKEFQLFFKGSKDEKFITHIFMLPYLLRIYFFYFIVSYFFEYPIAQTILITLLSLFLLIYMLWKKPFTSQLVFWQHISDETIMLIVNICMLSLAALDPVEDQNAVEVLGNVIIYSNIIFNITANIYLVCYLVVGFRAAYENTKKHKKKGLLSWLTALLAPYEAGGMDLEVIPQKDFNNFALSPSSRNKDLEQNSDLMETESIRRDFHPKPGHGSFGPGSFHKEDPNGTSFLIKDRTNSFLLSPSGFRTSSPQKLAKVEDPLIKDLSSSRINTLSSSRPSINPTQEFIPPKELYQLRESVAVNDVSIDNPKPADKITLVPIESNQEQKEKVSVVENIKDQEKQVVLQNSQEEQEKIDDIKVKEETK